MPLNDLQDIWGNLDVAEALQGAAEEPPVPADDTDMGDENNNWDERAEAGGGRGDFGRRWERLVSSEADPGEEEADLAGSDTAPRGHPGARRED